MILVQAVNIALAAIVTLNVLPAFVVTDVGTGLQVMPVTPNMSIIMVVPGGQRPEKMQDINTVTGIDIALVQVPVALVLMAAGRVGQVGMFMMTAVLLNTVLAAVASLLHVLIILLDAILF